MFQLSAFHFDFATAHFIKDWTLGNKVLQSKAVYESQTGFTISLKIKCLISFGSKENVVAITEDNAANLEGDANLQCLTGSLLCPKHECFCWKVIHINSRWIARIKQVL